MNKKQNSWIRNKLARIVLIASLLIAVAAPVMPVSAAKSGGSNPSTDPLTNGCQTSDCSDPAIKCSSGQCDLIQKYVQPTIDVLAGLFGLIAVASIIMGSIQYATSEGDPQKSSKAKDRITSTIIALVAFILLYAFLEFLIPGGVFNRPVTGS